jgi:1-acyl-sn-glycerol-3-phosphate acyltransferase
MLIIIISLLALAGGCLIAYLTGAFCSLAWLWAVPVSFLGLFLLLAGLAFLFLWYLAKRVDTEKPQEEYSNFYCKVLTCYIRSVLPVVGVHVHPQGLEKIPTDGRFMLVCNHCSNIDPVILLGYFPDSQLAFISKRENKDMFLVGKLMHKLLCQLINRENDREALKTIINCINILKEDKASIAVFPERYIHDDRKFHHFRNGVFKIAQKANVPIVVCTMTNTADSISNLLHLKPSHIDLHLLEVIPAQELQNTNTAQIGQRIYDLMAADLGPENISDDE